MKVAIIAPSPVPFTIGGAEKLWLGMQSHFNSLPGVQCELIKVVVDERTFSGVLAAYRDFSQLSLSHFDLVISTKYPAWMVKHDNHIVYMQHKLRGLYDAYHFCKKPTYFSPVTDQEIELKENLDRLNDHKDLPAFFNLLQKQGYFSGEKDDCFPGPIARAIVHALDRVGLSPHSIERYFCISKNVRERQDYFPEGVYPRVLYHPSDLCNYRCVTPEHIFTVSRLDSAKRIDLLVSAYRKSTCQVKFYIAGEGAERARLEKLAGGDERIVFVGRLTDEEILDYYSKSYFIPYVPYDEDYGLITIESFLSSKPILTCSDSGGSLEWVQHNVTGFVAEPTEQSLSAAFNYLGDNLEQVAQMGRNAFDLVKRKISWDNIAGVLLAEKHAKSIAIVNDFCVYPPVSGGQARVFYLAQALSSYINVRLICFSPEGGQAKELQISRSFVIQEIPKPQGFNQHMIKLEDELNCSAGDIAAMLFLPKVFSDFLALLKKSLKGYKTVVCEHAYVYPVVKAVHRANFIYDAHNVEYDIKHSIWQGAGKEKALNQLLKVEKELWLHAKLVLACSAKDIDRFQQLYGKRRHADPVLLPNGVVYQPLCLDEERRAQIRTKLGVAKRKVCVFIGSRHQPNVVALNEILITAAQLHDVDFWVLGNVCEAVKDTVPANVTLWGTVADAEKHVLLECADVGLNLVYSGSGTNLKVLDYLAHGLQVITTQVGARGFESIPSQLLKIVDDHAWGNLVIGLAEADANSRIQANQSVYHYGWHALVESVVDEVLAIC